MEERALGPRDGGDATARRRPPAFISLSAAADWEATQKASRLSVLILGSLINHFGALIQTETLTRTIGREVG